MLSLFSQLCVQRIVVEWQHGHRRVLVMTLSPGGDLVPRSCLSDLYLPYSVQSARGSIPSAMLPAEDEAMATVTAAVSAVVSATPGALLIPLPPASSSFTTLDGVPRGKCAYFVRRNTSDGPLTASILRRACCTATSRCTAKSRPCRCCSTTFFSRSWSRLKVSGPPLCARICRRASRKCGTH